MAVNNSNANTQRVLGMISASGNISETRSDESASNRHNKSAVAKINTVETGINGIPNRFTRAEGGAIIGSQVTTHNRDISESNFRRTQSFRDRRDINNRGLLDILQRKYTPNDVLKTEREKNSEELDGRAPSTLRRTQSLRDRSRNSTQKMISSDIGFSLSSVLRDDLENLRGSSSDLSVDIPDRQRGSYARDNIPPEVPPRVPPRSRIHDRYQFLSEVPENTTTLVSNRTQQPDSDHHRVNRSQHTGNRWPSTEELGSSSNLSMQLYNPDSPNTDETSSYTPRLSYTSRFREMLQESQRTMFQSIGRELNPYRSFRQPYDRPQRQNQTGSLGDLYEANAARYLADAGGTSRVDTRDGSNVESRASRVMNRLQRSASDISCTQQSENFQSRYHQKQMLEQSYSVDSGMSERGFSENSLARVEEQCRLGEHQFKGRVEQYRSVRAAEQSSERITVQARGEQHDTRAVESYRAAEEHTSTDRLEQYRSVVENRKKEVITTRRSLDVGQNAVDSLLESGNVKELLQVGTIQPRTPTGRRKLILDEQKLQELFLNCHVCGETYNTSDKLPKLLPCHHTFCLGCLIEIHRIETEHRKNMTVAYRAHMPTAIRLACPSCRDAIIVTCEELEKLPNDRTVVALLEVVVQSEACVVTYCSKHQTQPLNFFCETCILPVCCDCTVLEHSQAEGHVVRNIEEALKKYVPMLETTLDSLDDHYRELVDQKSQIETTVSSVQTNCTEVSAKLKETFSHFRTAADDRQEELVEIIQRELTKKQDELAGYLDIVKKRRQKLKYSRLALQSAQEELKVEEVFNNNARLKKELDEYIDIPTNFSEDIPTNLEFDDDEQTAIVDKLSEFGDVNIDISRARDRS